MVINIPEADDIYFAKTRDYFQEVLSSYASGYYRSAVVMLYSVAICDMLFKLQELRDMYNDTVAGSILTEVEKCRNANDNKSKSKWEKELVDRVYKDTELLDLEAYTNLNHLYDYRNFSAHPALNDNYELVTPSRETTIAFIKNTLKDILVKPPFYIKSIVDVITDDLEGQIEVYKNKKDILEKYLQNKYYSRMTLPMKLTLFRAFWKFCFVLTDDKCAQNRTINRMALLILCHGIESEIESYIEENKEYFGVEFKKSTLLHLIVFLDSNPYVYNHLTDETKLKIDKQIERKPQYKVVTWFKYSTFDEYFAYLQTLGYIFIDSDMIEFVSECMRSNGETSRLLDFFIDNFGKSNSYQAANHTYYTSVKPYIHELSKVQILHLLSVINSNRQINYRYNCFIENTRLVRTIKDVLGKDFDYSKYEHFEFDETVLEENTETEIEDYI